MKNLKIKETLTTTLYKSRNKLEKHSPEILAVVGVTGIVTSAVLACKASLKLNDILDEAQETLEQIKKVEEDPAYAEKYSEEDGKQDKTIVYVQTGVKIVKLYLPAVALGVSSIGAMLASNQILRKRNAALSAAYVTIDKSFKEYRKRVAERFGDEVEKEIRYNIKAQEVTETVVDEDGNESTVTKTVKTADPNLKSDYARFFDEYSPMWKKDSEYNLMFLRTTQQYCNDMLRARGRLFLNEVYRELGIQETKAGQIVGWVYNPENPVGDNFVDFGIYNLHDEQVRAFVNGIERSILLDFNVDGNILDLM